MTVRTVSWLLNLGLPVSFDLLLEPDVFFYELLIPSLALFEVVKPVSSADFLFPIIGLTLIVIAMEDTH